MVTCRAGRLRAKPGGHGEDHPTTGRPASLRAQAASGTRRRRHSLL